MFPAIFCLRLLNGHVGDRDQLRVMHQSDGKSCFQRWFVETRERPSGVRRLELSGSKIPRKTGSGQLICRLPSQERHGPAMKPGALLQETGTQFRRNDTNSHREQEICVFHGRTLRSCCGKTPNISVNSHCYAQWRYSVHLNSRASSQGWSISNFPCSLTRNITLAQYEEPGFSLTQFTQMKDDYTTNSYYFAHTFGWEYVLFDLLLALKGFKCTKQLDGVAAVSPVRMSLPYE